MPALFCFKQEDGRLVFVESGEKHYVKPSERLRDEVNDLLGQAGSYYAKVDTSLPDPPKRRWQKESNGNRTPLTGRSSVWLSTQTAGGCWARAKRIGTRSDRFS